MNKDTLKEIHNHLLKIGNMEKVEVYKWFFKTGKGEYGKGDKFIGLTTPQMRRVVKTYYRELSLKETEKLLHSPFHEERLIAL